MTEKRKRVAAPTVATARGRRYPRQHEPEPQPQDGSITSDNQALYDDHLQPEQPGDERDAALPSASKRPRRAAAARNLQSQLKNATTNTTVASSSKETEASLKRPKIKSPGEASGASKRQKLSSGDHQTQLSFQHDKSEEDEEDKEAAFIISGPSDLKFPIRAKSMPCKSSRATLDHFFSKKRADPDIPELVRSRPYSGPMRPRTQLALHLPPLFKLGDIFKSLTERAMDLNLADVLNHLGSRRLRVVTVCSGTESPLLALEMVRENLRKSFGLDLDFKHLFSAEIVPFKQAYIERNFHPKLLFRDVAELKDRVAQTAYGSLEKIPKNVDILIAGFSCVDFSGLNNRRKTLDEEGESGGTFWGIIRYAMTYRPRLVILENVKTAPWMKIEQHWNDIGYFTIHADVDTKAYYLPQTRERGYMFCVDKRLVAENGLSGRDMHRWSEVFGQFKRPASSPAGMFLMDADDRRLEQIEKDMSAKIAGSASSSRAAVNWDRYQVRHQSYRLNQGLGYRRPVSRSQDDGTCRMPDFAWQTWVKSLPERVWDTIDVNFLRKLVDGYDMNYKERCLELSQGIDREIDTRAFGIVGCITPCGIPYMTTRGGPLCGLESLALQGLPLDRLLLTQESQRELQDLAGNAMSSTVVGAAILSALIVGYKVLPKGSAPGASMTRAPRRKSVAPQGDEKLVASNMHLDNAPIVDVAKLQAQARSSARYCMCERQSSTRATILKCTLCSHTACSECSGNPQHAYERWTELVRTAPLDFISMLRSTLPARLLISGLAPENYKYLQTSTSIAPDIWSEFLDSVSRAVGDELRFLDVKRSEIWTVLYEGKSSVLKLVIESKSITWLLFAKPRESDPTLCLIREVLSRPIARMVVPQTGLILEGDWEICAPLSSSCSLGLFGSGSRIQTYEAKCGLELAEFKSSLCWTHITVQGSDEEAQELEIDVRGTYELLQDCGTANACLHKRPAADGKPTLYLFLDPTKLGEPRNDSFVFALNHMRNPGYTGRLSIAEVSHLWRSSQAARQPETTMVYHRKWMSSPTTSMRPYAGETDGPIRCRNLEAGTVISIGKDGCHNANITLLAFTIPTAVIDPQSMTAEWEVTDPVDSPQLLRGYAWLLQKAAGYSNFREWNEIAGTEISGTACTVCVPTKPSIRWGRDVRGRIKAYEDPYSAARYERESKSRPPPFLIFSRSCAQGSAEIHVALNVQTLLHQAYGRMMNPFGASFCWRLVPNSYDARELPFPKFALRSNRADPPSLQPPRFLVSLRPEQLRSLGWMIRQEGDQIESFIEEETEEARLPSLMWRAEGKVTMAKTIRGGVLADDVGYGKTAIVLGLIDTLSGRSGVDMSVPLNDHGFIPSNATLIVVPSIMLQQWQSEITKFVGKKYNVLAISSGVALRKTSIQEIRDCDIILVSWSVFNTASYYQRLQRFTGAPHVPTKAGRNFDDWFSHAHGLMKTHIHVLANQGPYSFLDALHTTRTRTKDSQEEYRYVPSKRLRGKKYAQANQEKDSDVKVGVSYAELSSADDNSDTSDDDNPLTLEGKVGELLRRLPPKPFGTATAEQGGEQQATDAKSEKAWDDFKEFGIVRTGNSRRWENVKGVPLHAFAFNRLVIDEFTYVNADRLAQLLALQARSRWVLSGTPPLNDFADVNTIAPFLGVHLGIDDDDTNPQNRRLKALRNQRSDAETFQSFKVPRSEAWHRRRHEIAQTFLDRFARRNVAEIDEIPSTEYIILVRQTPAEKAIYLELYKQLMTYNRQLRRSNSRGFASDQAERLDEIIASSSSTEEALLKRCTSLALQGRWDDKGKPEVATCLSLIRTREEQLAKMKDDLKGKLKLAAWIYCACGHSHDKFDKFVKGLARHDFGDMTVTADVYDLLTAALNDSKNEDWKLFFASPDSKNEDKAEDEIDDQIGEKSEDEEDTETDAPKPSKKKSKDVTILPVKPTQQREFEPVLREVTTTIRNLVVEWVLRQRALRFLTAVRQIQTNFQDIPPCDKCQKQMSLLANMNILGSCGHALCPDCTQETSEKEECAVEGCRGSGKHFNIINAITLECDTLSSSSSSNDIQGPATNIDQGSKFGGSKLEALIDIVQNRVPQTERILLFIQFPDLLDIACKALTSAEIKHTAITSSDRSSSQKIDKFQRDGFGDSKVLLLNLGSEMAAGLNLQCANHIIFLSPLFTQTQYDYESSMTQAIGRCRRYGQTKHVHVYHLLAKMTIDVNIFQDRRSKVLVERDGEAVLVDSGEALESETITCRGPEMVVDNAF
ncbi:hypothetical protein BJX76DRAFT_356020 [Aspergillus varians]